MSHIYSALDKHQQLIDQLNERVDDIYNIGRAAIDDINRRLDDHDNRAVLGGVLPDDDLDTIDDCHDLADQFHAAERDVYNILAAHNERLAFVERYLTGLSVDNAANVADEPAEPRDIIDVLRQLLADRGYVVSNSSVYKGGARVVVFAPSNGE